MPSPTGALGAQRLEARARLAGVRRIATSIGRSPHALALADQAVVSSTSFLTIVVLARYSNAAELGAYSFVLALVAAILLVQDSLILTPYSIYARRDLPAGGETESSNLALAAGLTLMSVAAALAYLSAARAFGAGEQGTEVAKSLAILAPGALLREFVKRMDLVHLRMRRVLAFDVAFAGLAGAMLAGTVYFERVSSASASACVGVAGGLLFCVWLALKPNGGRFEIERLRATLVENLRVGGWYLISQTAALVRGWITFWLLFAFEGAAATGVFAACTSVVAFGNPILYGLSNILPGRSAQAWAAGGGAALKKQVAVDAALLGGALGALCLALALAGGRLLDVFFSAPEFQANGAVVLLLALSSLATGLGLPVSRGLAIMEKPRAVVTSSVAGTVVTVAAVLGFMLPWGVSGAAFGLFIGNLVGTGFRWLAFLSLAPADPDLAPTLELARSALGAEPELKRLGEGDHAVIYAAARRGVPAANAARVVIKQFKRADEGAIAEAQAQFDALGRLHRSLDGARVGSWSVHAPRPLRLSLDPLAILMSEVPGRDLFAITESGACDNSTLEHAGSAIAMAMQPLWRHGRGHGDFGLQNILCDPVSKTIAFIDPGSGQSCPVCSSATAAARVAASDLGHLVADLCTDLSTLTGNSRAYARRWTCIVAILRRAAEDGAVREQASVRKAVAESTLEHLRDKLQVSYSPRGMWGRFVRAMALRRLEPILEAAFLQPRNAVAEPTGPPAPMLICEARPLPGE